MEEKVEEVLEEEVKATLWTKIKWWCKDHPDVILTVAGGIASIVGGCIKLYANKSEYEDHLFTQVDGQVYKLPAKEMKTCAPLQSEKKDQSEETEARAEPLVFVKERYYIYVME